MWGTPVEHWTSVKESFKNNKITPNFMDIVLFENFVKQANQFAKTSKQNRPKAKEWHQIANSDIEVSRILFDKGYLAHAIYFMQQSYEKITKCYYILNGKLNPEDAKGHKFNLVRLKKETKDEFMNNTFELMKEMSKKISNSNIDHIELRGELLDIIDKKEDEFRLINQDAINVILKIITNIESSLTNQHFIKSVEKKLKRRKFKKNLKHLLFLITHFRVSYSQIDEMTSETNVISYIMNSIISIKLLLLGMITFLHYNTPRYPYDKYSAVSFFNYTEDMGIVQSYDALEKSCKEIIKHLDEEYFKQVSLRPNLCA